MMSAYRTAESTHGLAQVPFYITGILHVFLSLRLTRGGYHVVHLFCEDQVRVCQTSYLWF
jgi:hypothetical protein